MLAAVAQMTSTDDLFRNFDTCRHLCEKAASRNVALLSLPECFAFIGSEEGQTAKVLHPDAAREWLDKYCALAREHNLWLSLGGFPLPSEHTGRPYNAHLLVDQSGAICAEYHKIHLFDVAIPNGPVLKESDHNTAGYETVVVDSPLGRLGLAVCYDLRFSEMFLEMNKKGAELLAIPAAFTLHTGKEHWDVLQRARAIENQCYVLAAAQTGKHNAKRESFGHAVIVDPWGTVIAQCSDGTGIAVAEIDLHFLQSVRQRMPMAQHRRRW